MLPIIDKPIVHYVVEEAVNSGIEEVILVTQAGQHSIEDYFDSHFEIEKTLEETGKFEYLKIVRDIPQMANFVYVRQKKHLPYGNGTPLLCAAPLIDDDESFLYMFGDDMTLANSNITISKQLINVFKSERPDAILAVQEVPDSEVQKYATVKYKKKADYKYEIEGILEKMPLGKNLSNMAQFGRFVFNYDVIREAEKTSLGKDNELWVTDILNNLAKKGKKVIAQPIDGEWLTTGDPLHYMKAQVRFALERKDIGNDFAEFLKNLKL